MPKKKFIGNLEFTTVLTDPGSATVRLLAKWSKVPLLLMRDRDWECEPLVVLGFNDYMMWPLLPPGSVLRLDKKSRTIVNGRWSEFERPIYLIEHNNKLWVCHAQRKSETLFLISHAESPCPPAISIPFREALVRGRLTPVFRPLATHENVLSPGDQRTLKA